MKWNSFLAAIGVAFVATFSVGFVNVAPKVIYGEDNRVDLYQVHRADVREIADSTLAMILNGSVKRNEDGFVQLKGKQFGQRMNLCSSEPFFEQPSVASCTGFLVGEDLMATAGHCFQDYECDDYSFIFGFHMLDEKNVQQRISSEDVYSCKEIIARESNWQADYALVRLDRSVRGHRVLPLQREPAQEGDDVYVIGHPSGLPTKVADGAKVRLQKGTYFKANLDTYAGNSGSPVFNARTNEVVGILVRGDQDFILDSEKKCRVSNFCKDEACVGESSTNISYIAEALTRTRL